MRTFGIEIWDDEGRKTTFYSVRKPNSEENETEQFFLRFENDPIHRAHAQELVTFILESIGDDLGAREEFFRHEGAASALPPKPSDVKRLSYRFGEFPLRLFCIRLTPGLVILMNGGIKTSQKAQDSPDLVRPLADAKAFAKAIDKAMAAGELRVLSDGRTLVGNDDPIELFY